MNLKRPPALRLLLLLLLAFSAPAEVAQAQEELIMSISTQSERINIYQSTGILVQLTNRAGEPVVGQEVTFITDLGTVEPDPAVTGVHGEVWVTFIAASQTGVSHITASAGGVSETIEVTVAVLAFQWIVFVFPCLLGLFGIAGAAGLFQRHTKKAKQKE